MLSALQQLTLDPVVVTALDAFVTHVHQHLGADLTSIILYGSGAEGRMRATSDVNLMIVVAPAGMARIVELRDALRVARAAILLKVMWIASDEVSLAAGAFAVKFEDMRYRHKVLWGDDVVAALPTDRNAQIRRLRQILLNLLIRLRQDWVLSGGRGEQAARIIASVVGPLRVAAMILTHLQDRQHETPKAALQDVVERTASLAGVASSLPRLSEIREGATLADHEADALLATVIELTQQLHTLALQFNDNS
jgi:predicted nucleotidyltransferase